MSRETWHYCKKQNKLKPGPAPKSVSNKWQIWDKEAILQGGARSPVDGEYLTSRRQWRNHMAKHNLCWVGGEKTPNEIRTERVDREAGFIGE